MLDKVTVAASVFVVLARRGNPNSREVNRVVRAKNKLETAENTVGAVLVEGSWEEKAN